MPWQFPMWYYLQVVREGRIKIWLIINQVLAITSRGKQIKAKTLGQYNYVQAIKNHDIIFGIGPAGTGKTYLAVVLAIAPKNKEESHYLTRPAVEAGERLLPGDLQEKQIHIHVRYIRPL